MAYPSGGVPSFTGGTELTAAELNKIVDWISAMFPLGAYWDFHAAATSVETLTNGIWLQCNGVAVSRSTYSALNTHCSGLGYPDGSGDGSTTFNLPDFRGRGMVYHATASGSTSAKTLGNTDGLALASRTPKPSVSVSVSGTTGGGSAHTHTASASGSGGVNFGTGGIVISSESAHTHSFSGSGSGTVAPGWIVGGMRYIKAFD